MRRTSSTKPIYVTTTKPEAAGCAAMGCGIMLTWAVFVVLKIAVLVAIILIVLDVIGIIAL